MTLSESLEHQSIQSLRRPAELDTLAEFPLEDERFVESYHIYFAKMIPSTESGQCNYEAFSSSLIGCIVAHETNWMIVHNILPKGPKVLECALTMHVIGSTRQWVKT